MPSNSIEVCKQRHLESIDADVTDGSSSRQKAPRGIQDPRALVNSIEISKQNFLVSIDAAVINGSVSSDKQEMKRNSNCSLI